MKLWTSTHHAKYELDPSSGLAIIPLKNLIYNFNVKFSQALTLISNKLGCERYFRPNVCYAVLYNLT